MKVASIPLSSTLYRLTALTVSLTRCSPRHISGEPWLLPLSRISCSSFSWCLMSRIAGMSLAPLSRTGTRRFPCLPAWPSHASRTGTMSLHQKSKSGSGHIMMSGSVSGSGSETMTLNKFRQGQRRYGSCWKLSAASRKFSGKTQSSGLSPAVITLICGMSSKL